MSLTGIPKSTASSSLNRSPGRALNSAVFHCKQNMIKYSYDNIYCNQFQSLHLALSLQYFSWLIFLLLSLIISFKEILWKLFLPVFAPTKNLQSAIFSVLIHQWLILRKNTLVTQTIASTCSCQICILLRPQSITTNFTTRLSRVLNITLPPACRLMPTMSTSIANRTYRPTANLHGY